MLPYVASLTETTMSHGNPLNPLSRRGLLGFMALIFALPAASVPLHAKVLTLYGTVTYRERVALPIMPSCK